MRSIGQTVSKPSIPPVPSDSQIYCAALHRALSRRAYCETFAAERNRHRSPDGLLVALLFMNRNAVHLHIALAHGLQFFFDPFYSIGSASFLFRYAHRAIVR